MKKESYLIGAGLTLIGILLFGLAELHKDDVVTPTVLSAQLTIEDVDNDSSQATDDNESSTSPSDSPSKSPCDASQ